MNAFFDDRALQSNVHAPTTEIMRTAAAIAQEISERWPFRAVRISLELGCAFIDRDLIGEIVTLGLSGIFDSAADPRRTAATLALQKRMIAIRLAGGKLIAFCPKRDVRFIPQLPLTPFVRLGATVWSADGRQIGYLDRACRKPEAFLEFQTGRR